MHPPRPLPVLVRIVRATRQLSEVCAPFDLDCRTLMLVAATDRPSSDLSRVAADRYNVPAARPTDMWIQAHASSIVDFARQHPGQLLARPGTGRMHMVTDPGTAEVYTPWADLGTI